MLTIRPQLHDGALIRVDPSTVTSGERGSVILGVEALTAETFDDQPVDRALTPTEARALAAALVWAAAEAER